MMDAQNNPLISPLNILLHKMNDPSLGRRGVAVLQDAVKHLTVDIPAERLRGIVNPERDTAAFREAKWLWCRENNIDVETNFFDLPLAARSDIMRRAHAAVTK